MVSTFQKHLIAIKDSFGAFFQGKFLLYFIPGLLIALGYYFLFYLPAQRALALVDGSDSIPYIGAVLSWSVNGIFDLFQTLTNEFYKFSVLVLLSPVYTMLSEKFDSHLSGSKYEFSLLRLINDLLRMLLIVITALLLEFAFLSVWFILDFILPEFIGETLFFLISSYFLGFSFYDYSLERHRVTVIESWGYGFKHIGSILLTGIIFSLLLELPIAGIVIAPVLATMISTSVYLQGEEKANLLSDN